jgi:hypothetical protein
VLVLRVWWEPGEAGGLRARVLTDDSGIEADDRSVACAGVDTVVQVVERWLAEFMATNETRRPHDPPRGPP